MTTVNINSRKSPNVLKKQGTDQWIKLNVGGQYFLTTKTTLSRDPNSFLSRLIQEDCDLISDKVSALHFVCIKHLISLSAMNSLRYLYFPPSHIFAHSTPTLSLFFYIMHPA